MPYPYTLTPDGHTLEPEDVVKPPAESQEESTSTHSPFLDFGNPLPPAQQSLPTEQSSGQASSSDSGEQGSAGASQTAISPTSGDANGETNARAMLRDIGRKDDISIDSVVIDAKIAAQQNELLKEALQICQYEGVPPILRNHPDIFLGLCADYGMDEEKDAEAKAHLALWTQQLLGSDGRQHSTYNPTLKATELWVQAHAAFDPYAEDAAIEVTSYRAHLETTYGVTFTRTVTRNKTAASWDRDLLGLRSAHLAFEMLSSVLGEWSRHNGFYWDDATAFRRIMGDKALRNSLESPPTEKSPDGTIVPTASAKVVGRTVQVFWMEREKRNFHLDPNVMLHELGHIYNANAGFGNPYSAISINETAGHPKSRAGMGSPELSLYLGKKPAYNPWLATYPEYYQIISVVSPDDKIFANVPWSVPRRLPMLQQSPLSTPNEITADAILNLSYEQTSDDFGFTDDAKGLKWLAFMTDGMDSWNPFAITYNILRSGEEIPLTAAEKDLMPFPIPVCRGVIAGTEGPRVRSGPSIDYRDISSGGLELGRDIIVLGRNRKSEDSAFPDWVAVLYQGDINWIYRGGVQLPVGVSWDDLPFIDNSEKLNFGEDSPLRNIESWFPILVEAAYGS